MAKKKIETIVENVVEEVKDEANEAVGTVTFKRWQVVLVAALVTIGLLTIIL